MENEIEIGNIVLKVQEDLGRLQEKLKLRENQSHIDVDEIKDLITTAQNGLQKRAEEILNQLNNRVISSSSIENVGPKNKISAILPSNQDNIKEINMNDEDKTKEILPLDHISPGEAFKRETALRSISNPYNKMNRYFTNEMYGVQLPLIHGKVYSKHQNSDSIKKGSMVRQLEKLPLETGKNFNNAKLAKITECDARKGLLNLIERGLIPPNARIIFEPPPINKGSIPILSASTKHRLHFPAAINDQGYSLACYHIDESNMVENDYLDEDQMDGNVEKSNQVHSINVPNNKQKISEKEAGVRIRKPVLQKNIYKSQTNVRSLRNKLLITDIDENENPKYSNGNPVRKISIPPPTTPAAQLSKGNLESYHKILIKNGVLQNNTEDFIRFKRQYCLVWGGIIHIIEALEEFLGKYSIPIAFINGNRVADLSVEYELELKLTEPELLSCIINRDDVIKLLKISGRRFLGKSGRDYAAIVIQSKWRAHLARKFYLDYRRKRWAAGVIALQWILHMKMSHIKEGLKKTRLRQLANFHKRYQSLGSKWMKINSSRRVLIHLPSIGLSEFQRSRMKRFQEMQNHQMARLCDLMDNNVDVIYISPVPMNDEILQYYSKLLGLKTAINSGNSDDQKPINSRYKIIVPEAIKSFPNHNMCLSTILKYSPRAMGRIKTMIKGRISWIVPGIVHQDDLYIADELDVPIMGTEPDILHTYRTKSGIRKIFETAKVKIPPGDCGIVSQNQLHESLAQLITDNLNIKRWIFKTNVDIKSQGISYIDIDLHLSCYCWAQKEQRRYGEKWKKKWAQESAYNRILREVPEIIEKHLNIVDKKFYSSQTKFWKEFFSKGGVVEAFPGSDSITNITVNMFIDPIGNTHITGSGDQIHDGNPLNAWGYSVPQTSIESDDLNSSCLKVAEICKKNGIKGYFSIDFVTFIENNEENQLLWAIDIDFQYSDLASLMNLSIFTTNAKFKSDDHLFFVEMINQTQNSIIPLNRYVCLSTQLSHSNLSMVHYSVFFQMCRAHGIGFDLKEKQGTVFSLIDSFNRENICMICIGESLENTLESFAKNLYVLHREISSPNMAGHGNFQVVIKEIESILGLAIENSVIGDSKSGADL